MRTRGLKACPERSEGPRLGHIGSPEGLRWRPEPSLTYAGFNGLSEPTTSFFRNYWWFLLCSAGIAVWLWRKRRLLFSPPPEAPADLRPAPPVSPLRHAVGVVLLIVAVAWSLNYVVRAMREHRTWCERQYAAARTAADSAGVEALESCGPPRRR